MTCWNSRQLTCNLRSTQFHKCQFLVFCILWRKNLMNEENCIKATKYTSKLFLVLKSQICFKKLFIWAVFTLVSLKADPDIYKLFQEELFFQKTFNTLDQYLISATQLWIGINAYSSFVHFGYYLSVANVSFLRKLTILL